jgi:hypothetical protein
MNHSNQARELILNDHGIDLAEVFVAPNGGILTGSARAEQETADLAAVTALREEIARKQAALYRKRKVIETRIAEMQAELAAEIEEVELAAKSQTAAAARLTSARTMLAQEREHLARSERANLGDHA